MLSLKATIERSEGRMARRLALISNHDDVVEDHGHNTKEKKRKKKEQLEEELKHTAAEVSAWKTSNINR
jgi:ElaB/YqjD/DUF883 family membrane-anchored ribosome-binding protein